MNSIEIPYQCVRGFIDGVTSSIWRLEVRGLEFIPREGRTIVAINHVHWMDPLIAGAILARVRKPHFMAKQELFHIPVVGPLIRYGGAMPLDRNRADFSAVRSAIEVLEKEKIMVIFPEGTRARNGIPNKPKRGVSFLAHQTGAPVIPARIINTEKFPALVRLGIHFGSPVRYEGGESKEEYRQFAERIMENIFRL